MANGDIWQVVNTSYLNIRSSPSTSANKVGTLSGGDQITETGRQTVNGHLWIGFSRGWCATISVGTTYLIMVQAAQGTVTEITGNTSNDDDLPTSGNNGYDDSVGAGYQPDTDDLLSYTNSKLDDSEFVKIKNVAGVFGLPYQFLPASDVRLSGNEKSEDIGYEYADRIINRIPLLFISPGKANFMTRYSKSSRKNILEYLLTHNITNSDDTSKLEDLLTTDGRYYTFEYDRARYYSFVNPMCRIAARYLELQDYSINGTKLDKMNWQTYTDDGIGGLIDLTGKYGGVPFYVDADTSISENFSNSTTQSLISSSVNSVSDMGRELNFLLGYGAAGLGVNNVLNDADVMSNIENVNEIVNKMLGSGNFFSNLSKHLVTVASGGKLIFPEIWSDSSFSRSYTCEFKFVSPDPSKLSVYLNVLVPLFHLICLVAPQSVKDNPNGYVNPFLIRAIYKGFFNVDMGIITDMSVTKGAECQWTPEGIPTSINVSITIKDLYSAMSITSTDAFDWKYDTLNNTALMDYIANLCGVNIYKPEIGRMIQMWLVNNFTNRVNDLFHINIWASLQDRVQNLIMKIYR